MNKYKKALKLFILVCLIFLASLGIGLSGGVPIPAFTKRTKQSEAHNELVESKKEDIELKK